MKKFGIPNILSCLRIVLIPLFLWRYFTVQNAQDSIVAAGLLMVSGLTDAADGYIARTYNMITPIGKILDPAADKLTQLSVCVALTIKMPKLFFILALYVIKEVVMLVAGYKLFKKLRLEEIPGSKWFGKIYTICFYIVMIVIIGYYRMTENTALIMLLALGGLMMFTFVMYIPEYIKIKRNSAAFETSNTEEKAD